MRHLDLFSGIGGFALAASWVWGKEHEVVAFCEIEPYCQNILRQHWPDTEIIEDIRECDFGRFTNIDLLTGGFPCQDVSGANPFGQGLSGRRSGLWRFMLESIRETRPQWIMVENVPWLRKRGLGRILGDLAEIGYDAQWHSIAAAQVGAPHKRERVWLVAYPNGLSRLQADSLFMSIREGVAARDHACSLHWNATASPDWQIPERWLAGSDDGVSRKLACCAYGNAIIPQVAAVIMQGIKEIDSCTG